METLIHAVTVYSQDILMELGIEKCALLVMKSGKHHLTDGIEVLNQDKIRTVRKKGNLKILGDTGSWDHQKEMKEKIKKEYSRQNYIAETLWKQ